MLGPSGSGKTTTLRMIAGFELPDRGPDPAPRRRRHDRAAVRARRQHGLPGLRAVPAHDGRRQRRATGWWSARSPRPSADARRRGARGWSASRATSRRKPGQLSGGQRQRVALARALVNRPRVLLLDEPLGALDLKLREEMQIELKAIQQQVGITFIYVTHDQEEALTMSDRLAVFNQRPDRAGRRRRPRSTSDPRRGSWPASSGTSNLLRGEVARERSSARPGRSPSGPRRSAWPSPDAAVGADETSAPAAHPRGRLPRPGHPLRRRARRGRRARRHPAEPGDVLDRGARAAGQGCPPDLEATAQLPVADGE